MNGDPTIICQSAEISSTRSTTPGEGLVREVPPVKEPAKSAAKERQCVRYHRSKEREESAKRTIESAKRRAWSGGGTEEDPTTPARQLGKTSAALMERRRAPSTKTSPVESAKKSADAGGDTGRRSAVIASTAREPRLCGDSFEYGGPQVNVSFKYSVFI